MSLAIQNRNESYQTLNLTKSQERVFKTFEEIGPATNQQIANRLNIQINQVTGRTKELVDKGYLTEQGSVVGVCGKLNTLFDLNITKVSDDGQFLIF